MTGVSITLGFDDVKLRGHLGRLVALSATHFDGARREIGEYMVGEVQDNLDGQKLADGSAMPQSKAALKRSGKTLIDKHHLYDSYVWQLKGLGVEVGSGRVYAAIQHFGGDTGRGGRTHIAPRPVLGLKPKDEMRLGDFLIKQIELAQA